MTATATPPTPANTAHLGSGFPIPGTFTVSATEPPPQQDQGEHDAGDEQAAGLPGRHGHPQNDVAEGRAVRPGPVAGVSVPIVSCAVTFAVGLSNVGA